MNILRWYLWRRWVFINWCKDPYMEINDTLVNNLYTVDFAGCRSNPSIHRDMVNIASRMVK